MCDHPHIVKPRDIVESPDGKLGLVIDYFPGNFSFVLQDAALNYYSGGDLQIYIKTYGSLQDRHMVHHDIKPENILIDLGGNVVLSDFGVAHIFDESFVPALPICGTIVYAEPELVVQKTRYSPFKWDIWSLGIILFFLLTGKTPYIGDK